MPQLEIYADDVKCSHGATVGRLDEEALFYMRTRGVPEKDAKVLQMLSFLSPVTPEGDRERVEEAVLRLV
jgi:Fe-S cluster assembly protein SufD